MAEAPPDPDDSHAEPDRKPDWRAVREFARTFSLDAVRSLADLMGRSDSDPARVAASIALLRFGWGRRATTGEEKHDADTNIVDFLTAPSPQPPKGATTDRRVASQPGDVLPGGAAGEPGAVAEPGAAPDRGE